MGSHTILTIIKVVLAVIAAFLGITRGKQDKQLLFYWALVSIYWILNALS